MKKKESNQDILYTIGFNDFCREVSQKTGYPRTQSDIIVRAVFESIKHNLFHQTAVRITNFGVFYSRLYPGKLLKSVQGSTFWVGDHLVPKIRYSTNLRAELKTRKNLRRKNDN